MLNQKKTVFITGGSTGIGAASVRKFAECGWNVAFMDINVKDGQSVADETGALFIEGNTRNRKDIENAVQSAIEKYGELDCVVANAGIHRCNTMLTISEEELDLMIDTNIKGTVRTLQAAVPSILRKGGGSVVINASDQSYIGKANSFGYGLTKGALGQITKSLAIDLGRQNVRVNAVCAATIRTPLAINLFQKFADITHNGDASAYWKAEADLYPLGRVGEAPEVAELIYFLASDSASFITGGLYLIDGGLVAGSSNDFSALVLPCKRKESPSSRPRPNIFQHHAAQFLTHKRREGWRHLVKNLAAMHWRQSVGRTVGALSKQDMLIENIESKH